MAEFSLFDTAEGRLDARTPPSAAALRFLRHGLHPHRIHARQPPEALLV